MDTTKAQELARRATAAAGRRLLHQPDAAGTRQQTLTIARPVENVLQACRDPDVLSTLVGSAGTVRQEGPDTYVWTVMDTTVRTQVHVEPNRVVFSTVPSEAAQPTPEDPIVAFEAWPAPQGLGAEVVLRVASPAVGETVVGGLAFTMLYRLRALLQTGEVPTLGDVPSGRSGSADPQDDTSRTGSS